MKKAPLPANESARVKALHDFEILDTAPEDSFDDFTRLAAFICKTPIAVISMVDSDRQWFKSRIGDVKDEQTAREISFCQYTILQPGPFIVRDALEDERFKSSPLVNSDPHIRFYAGSPLVTSNGLEVGALCVIDRVPKDLAPEQISALKILSKLIMTQLELRKTILRLQDSTL